MDILSRFDPRRSATAASWLGAFIGIGIIAALDHFVCADAGLPFIIGSFGASSVLVYGAPDSPLAQPRNLIGGHVISAVIGVAFAMLLPDMLWLASALAVATAIAAMRLTGTVHPPGGATALIAVTGGEAVRNLGFLYVLFPCLTGAIVLLLVALVTSNLPEGQKYPKKWW